VIFILSFLNHEISHHLNYIIFFFRLIMPHLIRWALKAFIKKTLQNGTFTQAGQPFNNPTQPQPEGKIKVNYVPQQKDQKPKDFPGGEYVDYEEVK